MEILLLGIAALVVAYLIRNGRRNGDPLNRKCAAELCELLVSSPLASEEDVLDIFMSNARYRTQARHVVSMVPPLLVYAGYPKDFSLSFVPLLRRAEAMVPA